MRRFLLATILATLPVPAFSQSHCAIPATQPGPIRLPPPVDVTGPNVPLFPSRGVTSSTSSVLPTSDPLKHMQVTGAQITDLGISHGLRTVIARNGDQFMVFAVTPDGQATISGLMADIDLMALRAIGGKGISELPTRHGIRGFFLRNGPHFQVFYATPDEKRVIPGVMWDAAGNDITRDQVAAIPGTIPTVTLGNIEQKDINTADTHEDPLTLVHASAFGSVGDSHAPQLWMFVDPQCSFSVKAMQQLNPYVMTGRIHLNVIPISVLDQEDGGLSTRRAQELLSVSADSLVPSWRNGETGQLPAPESTARLQNNMTIAQSIDLKGTPTFLWMKPDGTTGRADGIPADLDAVIKSIKG